MLVRKMGFYIMALVFAVFVAACSGDGNNGNNGNDTNSQQEQQEDTQGAGAAVDATDEGDADAEAPGEDDQEDADAEQASGEAEEADQPTWKLLRQFASLRFQKPLALMADPLGSDILYIIEQPGRIVRVDPATKQKEVFLDITDRVHDRGWEQGLLGLAFHPDYATNGYFYVNYTTSTHTHIARFAADLTANGMADPGSEKILLTYEQPFDNHNGGDMHFGTDGMLYISSGDGGDAGDPYNNSQNLQSMLGKLIRIDVDREENGRPYAIPEDNPFIGQADALPEIYAYGLRNPWRFSFDQETGDLWVADVGQEELEEINLVESGGNYGWRIKEGSRCYEGEGCEREDLIDPVFEYEHSHGRSITGGYVYRGANLPELVGKYVYGDFTNGNIWALEVTEAGEVQNTLLMTTGKEIASFGRDRAGELYVLTLGGEIYALSLEG